MTTAIAPSFAWLRTAAAAGLLAAFAALPCTAFAQTGGAAPRTSMSALALSNDQPIQIESDNLKIDDKANIATFTGDVKVVQGDMLLRAGQMIVHYARDGENAVSVGAAPSGTSQIEKIDVSEKVYLKSGDQEATADQGTYDMSEQLLTLSGDQVVLTQGKNVFVGCKLTVHVATSIANLDSCGKRVMIQLDPKSQNAQQKK
jgi:lipopolysaccharide export system protein LptA